LIPEDKYYRIQPSLMGVDERMDNAKRDNIVALKVLADNVIRDNDRLIDKLCKLLLEEV